MNNVFEKYAQHVQKHPKTIIALWVVVLLVALPFAAQADDVLNYDMTSMGGFSSESSDGQELVDAYFDASLNTDTVLVIPYDNENGTSLSEIETRLVDSGYLDDSLSAKFNGNVSKSVMGSFHGDDSSKGVYLVTIQFGGDLAASDEIGNLRDAVSDAVEASGLTDLKTYVTGGSAITYDTLEGANSDIARIDPLSILLILVLIGLFFWTLVTAFVPPLVVGTAYGIVLALMFALGQLFDIFYITKTIVLVSMLGAGCDYSIFIIARYREERIYNGKDKSGALTEAIKWAGESVFTSGLAVIIGFAVMSLCSFTLVSTMAVTLALGIVMAMLAALSLIPAVISLVGDKIFWPRKIEDYSGESKMRHGTYGRFVSASRRYFSWAGKFSTKHAKPIVVVAILLTVPMAYVAFSSETSFDMISVMPDSEGKSGVYEITDNTDGGYLMPTYVLMEFDEPIAKVTDLGNGVKTLTWTAAGQEYVGKIQSELVGSSLMGGEPGALQAADSNISTVLGPTPWAFLYSSVEQAVSAQAEKQLFDGAYAKAIAAGASAEMAKATAEAYVQAHLSEYVNPSVINHAIVGSDLPDMITLPLEQFFEGKMTGGTPLWSLGPSDVLGPTMPVTVSSLIDYQLNVGAGLVSESASNPDSTGMYAQIMVIVRDEPMSQESMDSIGNARSVMSDFIEDNTWMQGYWVVGTAAKLYDISETVNTEFNYIEIGVMVLIYILLLFVLGVYFTPLRSLMTIMMSVLWTLGVLHLVFGTALGIDVVWIVPIVLFVICLGLGMDYDILLTTRIREGKLKGLTNDEAIQNALSWSGSIITLCGLIMGGTFLTMLSSGSSMLQEIGFALGFAILVDALIVVPYVVPALMHLMGDWSWVGPKFLEGRRNPVDSSASERKE